jgi:hypothetical protein
MEMEAEKTNSTKQATDVTSELAKLVALGWAEQHIAKFARMRATYRQTSDYPSVDRLTTAEKDRLSFTRWLYQNGRLAS